MLDKDEVKVTHIVIFIVIAIFIISHLSNDAEERKEARLDRIEASQAAKDAEYYREEAEELSKELNKYQDDYYKLVDAYNGLMDDYDNIYVEHDFYSHFAVCVNEGSGYYHSFKCSRFDKEENFKIYNISAAKDTGLEPCPNCRTDEQ